MNNIFLLIALILIAVVSYFTISLNKNKDNIKFYPLKKKKNCKINLMTPEICLKNNIDICPMSSYKQCTNNINPILYPPMTECSCNSFGLELCKNPESNLCNFKNCNIKEINQKYLISSSRNPRVNIYNSF